MESTRNGNLPEELVREILLRLPVKALLQCKCVCKEWCALIGSRSFIQSHFDHESNQDCLLIQRHNPLEKRYAFAMYQDDERRMRIEESNHPPQMPSSMGVVSALLGPVNGVFCTVSCFRHVNLFNPAMREFKPLPPIPLHDPSFPTFALAFGFGLDPISGDYKVVVFHQGGKSQNFVYVYNLSSDSWKRIEAVDLLNSMFCAFGYTCNTFLNGVYHWLMGWVNRGGFTILAFDMRSENFQEIRVPDGLKFRQTRLRITAYGDSLALLSYDVIAQLLDLWVMGKEGFWSKSLRVGPFQDVMWPLCVWKKNVMLEESKTSAVFLCDISTKKVRKVEQESNPCHLRSIFSYMESLVSIKGDGDRADCVQDFFD